jgi:hypothetical protein
MHSMVSHRAKNTAVMLIRVIVLLVLSLINIQHAGLTELPAEHLADGRMAVTIAEEFGKWYNEYRVTTTVYSW